MNDSEEDDTGPPEFLSIGDRPFLPTSDARPSVSIEWARRMGTRLTCTFSATDVQQSFCSPNRSQAAKTARFLAQVEVHFDLH